MGEEAKRGSIASRVPEASTLCYAIARSWRRHSIKRRTRHHGRPINPQTKVDYDFSRGHRSRLLLRPVHTHERVHRFFWPTCTVDEFEYRADRRELLRPVPLVHHEISFCPFFPLFYFYFDTNEISVRVFHQQWNINASISRVIIFLLFFFLIIHFCIHEWIEEGACDAKIYYLETIFVEVINVYIN